MKIGFIEINHNVKITVIKKEKNKITIENELFYKSLKEITNLKGINHFIINVPDNILNFRLLELPFNDKKRIREIIPYELANMTLIKPDEMVFETKIIKSNKETQKVLVGFLKKKELEKLLEKLKKANIIPERVTSIMFNYIDNKFDNHTLLLKDIPVSDKKKFLIKEVSSSEINFLSHGISKKEKSELKFKLFERLMIFFIVMFLIIGINLTIYLYKQKKYIHGLNQRLIQIYTDVFPSSKVVAPVYQMKAALKEIKGQLKIIEGSNVLDILLRLSRHSINNVIVNNVEIYPDRIILKGETSEIKSLELIKSKLKKEFQEVKLVNTEKLSHGSFRFTIELKGKKDEI